MVSADQLLKRVSEKGSPRKDTVNSTGLTGLSDRVKNRGYQQQQSSGLESTFTLNTVESDGRHESGDKGQANRSNEDSFVTDLRLQEWLSEVAQETATVGTALQVRRRHYSIGSCTIKAS